MGGFTRRLEDVLKGIVLAATLGVSAFNSGPSFAEQQKVVQDKKAESKKLQEAKREDEPDDATQRFREDQVKRAFSDDYKKKDLASKLILADKLAKSSDDPKNDAALSFVLKREAIRAYAEGFDLNNAFDLAERLSESYKTTGLRYKCEAFNISRKLVKDAEQAASVAEGGYELTANLYVVGDLGSAVDVVADAKKIPKLSKEVMQKLADLETEVKVVQSADTLLTTMPDDAKANGTVARYTAFRRGKLDEAKDFAKKSKDQVLIDLIDGELSMPDNSESQYMIANQYFEAAKKLKGFEKEQYVMRCVYWFNEALPNANALVKADIEKKLKEVGPTTKEGVSAKGKAVNLLSYIDLQKDKVEGEWKAMGRTYLSPAAGFARMQLPYIPSDEYDLKVVAERKEGESGLGIGLVAKNKQFLALFDANGVSGLEFIAGKGHSSNETTKSKKIFADKKPHAIVCSVRKDKVTVTLDGMPFTEWKNANYDNVSLHGSWNVPNKNVLFIGSWASSYLITQYEITAVSGTGQKTR